MQFVGTVKKVVAISTLVGGMSAAIAAPISLVNQGFETGDLFGWDTIGEVSAESEIEITTSNQTVYTLTPNGTTMAYLNSQGSQVSEIEAFFGIDAGSLFAAQDNGSNGHLTNGSAISQNFVATAGDTIDMSWNYVARDYIPFTDPAFAVLVAPDGTTTVEVLASTTGPGLETGSDGISGVFNFASQLTQTGEYKIGFATTNSSDTALNSALFIDDGASNCQPTCNDLGTPENPFMPIDDETPEVFDFAFTVTEPSDLIFIDPVVAVGYEYEVQSGPNVASVVLPEIGDGIYEIFGWDGTGYNNLLGEGLANIAFNFGPLGVSKFKVLGIETSAMLDPNDSLAFNTGLTFISAGDVVMTQTPISLDIDDPTAIPGPETISIFLSGLFGMLVLRRRNK